jgi:hypothetical protein
MASYTGFADLSEKELADFKAYALDVEPKVEAMDESLKQVSAAKVALELATSAAEKADAAKAFKAIAVECKSKEAAASDAIEKAASKTGLSTAKVLKVFRHYMEEKDMERVLKILKMSQSLDLCFVMDATGSMGAHIQGVKNQIRSIIAELQAAMQYMSFRLSFVAYRDVGDGPLRFEVHNFSGSITELEKFAGSIVASGGNDECEDVVGALAKAADMTWTMVNKVVILCADAPCHGSKYHDGCNDDYPTGEFPGSKDPAAVLAKLRQIGVKITFLKLNSTTDKMIKEFNKLFGNGIETMNLDRAKLAASIKESIKESLTSTFSASASKAENHMKPRTFAAATSRLEKVVEEGASTSSHASHTGSRGGSTTGHDLLEERLERLKKLKDQGLITMADLERRTAEILAEI